MEKPTIIQEIENILENQIKLSLAPMVPDLLTGFDGHKKRNSKVCVGRWKVGGIEFGRGRG